MEHVVSQSIDHPAVHAFASLHPEFGTPARITTLKDHPESSIFRLEGIGPSGMTVVAKRLLRPGAVVERHVYEELLPQIPVSQPFYYGSWTSPDDSATWLFTEDLGEERYVPADVQHRKLAAQWLGVFHTTAANLVGVSALPDRGPQHYLGIQREAFMAIRSASDNSLLSNHARRTLRTILQQLKSIELHWFEVEEICASVPKTLVHGDFVNKNVRVRKESAGLVLLPFDWESAGFGTLAADLETPDIAVYQSVVYPLWPQCDLRVAQALANIGRLFRLIMLIFWGSAELSTPWAELTMIKQMNFYQPWLESVIRSAGW